MKARRWICLVLALMLTMGCACAEAVMPTPEPTQEPVLEQEAVHELVNAMFRAAAGTTYPAEKELRAAFDKETKKEQTALRTEELKLHRAKTVVWLREALRPEETPDPTADMTASPSPSPSPTPSPTSSPVPGPTSTPDPLATPEPPVWTLEDAWEQMLACEEGMAYIGALRALGGDDMESCMEIMRWVCGLWMAEVQHERMEEINEDYVCWLFCADTKIDYPVVQGEDNSYYLHRMFNGEHNAAGTLFIDYRNLPDFQDPNTLIYGHHMRNNSMFGALNDYELDGFYEAHPFMLMFSAKEVALIEVFAGYTTSEDDHCYDIAISDSKDMLAFVAEAQSKSDFETAITVLPGDRLVTLSTCAYAFEDARYIALGRLATLWKDDPFWQMQNAR